MKDKSVSQAIIDFANSRDPEIVKHFKYSAEPDEIFTVTITRNKTNLLSKHASMEAFANTISALPSGSQCGCCGGSGRSR